MLFIKIYLKVHLTYCCISVAYNVPETSDSAEDRATNKGIQVMGDGSNRDMQRVSSLGGASGDSSTNRKPNGNGGVPLSISSPYIRLSTCYAGKVGVLKN